MTYQRTRNSIRAFTIIELLVVISIIAVLASLLLPVLGQAKRKAQSIACVNKIRQWGLAIKLYTDDNQEKFPFDGTMRSPINAGPNKKAWYNSTARYIGSDSLTKLYGSNRHPMPGKGSMFTCTRPTNLTLRTLPTVNKPFFMYGLNGRLVSDSRIPSTEDKVMRPVQTILFTDNTEKRVPFVTGTNFLARHDLKISVAFVDGHASSVKSNVLYRTPRLDASARREWQTNRLVYWYPEPGMAR